jgi:FAD binding domain
MTDPRCPAAIVRCTSTADVRRSVDFCRTNDIAIAVRAGGHSLAGDSFCNGGVLIDVSGMKAINLDLNRRSVRVAAGLTAAELDRATQLNFRGPPQWKSGFITKEKANKSSKTSELFPILSYRIRGELRLLLIILCSHSINVRCLFCLSTSNGLPFGI